MQMKMYWKSAMLGLLIVISTFVIVNSLDFVAATDRYVGGGGVPNYPTISAAVSAASSGDTILVNPIATYVDNVVINKALTIMGNGGNADIVPASGSPVFTISVPRVTIKYFNIDGQDTANVDGIYSTAVAGEENQEILIESCNIHNCVNGIHIGTPSIFPDWHHVKDCWIYENSLDGVLIYSQSGYHLIELCTINNSDNHGIEINGDYNTVDGCEIYYNLDGVHIFGDTNTITGDSSGSDDTYIYLNSDDGIEADGDYNSIIDDVFIHNNTGEGIYMFDSKEALISDCEIVYNGDNGIYLEESDDATISYSYFTENNDCAIKLEDCDGTYINNCDFSSGYIGVFFLRSSRDPGYDTDCCDFYDLYIAVKIEGSTNVDVHGTSNYGEHNDMLGCTYGIYAICDSSNNPSTGIIENYDITDNTIIYLRGYDNDHKTEFYYGNLEGSLTVDRDEDTTVWEESL